MPSLPRRTTDTPVVSVIIPAYDAMLTLPRQLFALAHQNPGTPRFEVIVANNGGNRGLKRLAGFFPMLDLHVVDATDVPGTAHARNVGAAYARADFLLFCDADDRVAPWWVASGVEQLTHRPAFSGGALECESEDMLEHLFDDSHTRRLQRYLQRGVSVMPVGTYPILLGQSFGITRHLFEELGGFTECYGSQGEDNDLAFRIQAHLGELVQVPEVLVAYSTASPKNLRTQLKAGYNNAWVAIAHDAVSITPSFAGHWVTRPLKESFTRRDPRPAVRMLGGLAARVEHTIMGSVEYVQTEVSRRRMDA